MPNMLNTGTTGLATSNPQTNINTVQSNAANPVATNPANTQTQMNPITIPIQIQPQVTTSGYAQTSNEQFNNNLQVAKAPKQSTTAPAPQVYQGNNQNSNPVNFNQIYSAYQNQYGNNQVSNPTGNSGIRRTSIGTTIVTPTANINTVQGQYQSAFADTINSVLSQLLESTNSLNPDNYNYDPSQDMALRVASEYAANSTLQSLAGSGVLNSSATAERVARIVSELIPQYEQLSYNRKLQYASQLASTADMVMKYDNQQFQYWADAKDRELKNREFEFEKQQKELENTWKRVDELGYVDNKASAILGVKVGTLSKDAREAKELREYELNKMKQQAELERKTQEALVRLKSDLSIKEMNIQAGIDKDLYKYKSNIELSNSKELASYQNSLNNSSKEYEYRLAQRYGTSSSKNSSSNNYTNYSTHDEIIKNRWGIEDIATGQITVNDGTTNNNDAAYNYLANAYASGLISQKDFAALVAKYGITVPQQKNTNKTSTSNTTNGTNSYGYGSGGGFR